jgi:hypothetical protein
MLSTLVLSQEARADNSFTSPPLCQDSCASGSAQCSNRCLHCVDTNNDQKFDPKQDACYETSCARTSFTCQGEDPDFALPGEKESAGKNGNTPEGSSGGFCGTFVEGGDVGRFFSADWKTRCTAALITPRYFLTAAQCVNSGAVVPGGTYAITKDGLSWLTPPAKRNPGLRPGK